MLEILKSILVDLNEVRTHGYENHILLCRSMEKITELISACEKATEEKTAVSEEE